MTRPNKNGLLRLAWYDGSTLLLLFMLYELTSTSFFGGKTCSEIFGSLQIKPPQRVLQHFLVSEQSLSSVQVDEQTQLPLDGSGQFPGFSVDY